jgi:methionyl-tRNA formyltransferase
MTGRFSLPPLQTLLENGVPVEAVILPALWPLAGSRPRRLPVADITPELCLTVTNILHLAWAHGLPVWEVSHLAHPATLEFVAGLQPDLMAVACFPHKFPPELLAIPRYGGVNLHPSLLPAYRGPAPLFWQARQGEPQTGVTLHYLDNGLDTGDIVAQTSFPWPEGIIQAALQSRCAAMGADLLLAAVRQLAATGNLPRRPQSSTGGSYFPEPAAGDCLIPFTWPARRAFNFLRGANEWPLAIDLGGERLPVRAAINYEPEGRVGQAVVRRGDEALVQFSPGLVRVSL